jgi:hypothetical protein
MKTKAKSGEPAHEKGRMVSVRCGRLVRRFVRMFKCDQARISSPCGKHFLILGWKANTAEDRRKNPEAGQWIKDGEPQDFDYVREETVASGDTEAELIASAKHYKRLLGMKWSDYFRDELGARKEVVDALKEHGL